MTLSDARKGKKVLDILLTHAPHYAMLLPIAPCHAWLQAQKECGYALASFFFQLDRDTVDKIDPVANDQALLLRRCDQLLDLVALL